MSSRLDLYLFSLLLDCDGKPEFSRVEIQNFIKNGAVKVNNNVVLKPSCKVKDSDKVDIDKNVIDRYLKEKEENNTLKPKEIDIKIVFENENLIIIEKQAGLSVHPGAGNVNNTLVNGLLALKNSGKLTLSNERGEMRLGIVHRLDKDTSGLMIVAKNNKAHRLLGEMIKKHDIDRRYLALCHGIPISSSGRIENFICRDKKNIEKMKICNENDDGAKFAITNYKVLKMFSQNDIENIIEQWKKKISINFEESLQNGDFFKFLLNYQQDNNKKTETHNNSHFYSLVECKLETGRTHQIRLHMQSIKHPLVGEKIYTTSNLKKQDEKIGFVRQMLHSYKLSFVEPITKENITIFL